MRRDLFVYAILLLLGYFALNLFDYAFQAEYMWQSSLLFFCSFLILYFELAWMIYRVDKRNWLWLTLCGFCLLIIPAFSAFGIPMYMFWIPCLIGCLAVYGYFVNRQMTKAVILLAIIGVAILIFSIVVWTTGIGVLKY